MVRIENEPIGVTGIALSAALGVGVGVLAGMVVGEFLNNVNTEPVRKAMRRLRGPAVTDEEADPSLVQRQVERALDDNPDTAAVTIAVQALGDGIIELTGTASDPLTRQLAGDIARGVPGAHVVVNRILVQDSETRAPGSPAASKQD